MDDSGLDDFFAKKDKSKRKTKAAAKFTASDILAKQSEKPKKVVKKKKEKDKYNQSGSTRTVKREDDDDEWVDYEEEAEKDFSDLKIQKLQTRDSDGERGGEGSGTDEDGSEGREKREAASGPWNKTTVTPAVTETAEPAVTVEEPPAPKPTGKYVPPAARRGLGMSTRKKKEAPNVMSEEDFPTLGGAQSDSVADGVSHATTTGRFEQVKGGGRQVDSVQGQSQRLEIGNKYDALSVADS